MSVRELILEEARSWIDTPYHHAARVKTAGVDCAWYLIEVFRARGLLPAEFDPGEYPADWALHRNEERYLNLVRSVADEVRIPQPGDAVLFRWGRCVSHGAIVESWPHIIHAARPLRKVGRDDASLSPYAERLAGFYSVVARAERLARMGMA